MASEALADNLYLAFEERILTAKVVSTPSQIRVIRKDSGSVDDLVQQALAAAGSAGACIFITRPQLVPQASATRFFKGTFVVEIAEDPTLNRGPGGNQRTGPQIEEGIVAHLVFWSHSLAIGRLYVRDINVPEEGAGSLRQITFGFGSLITS
jgi:hypothetical protein